MPAPRPVTTVFTVRGPIARSDLPGLCARICALLERSGPGIAICDVRSVAPDAVTVEALARLQLGARRRGCRVWLRHASPELQDLLAFLGLDDVVPEYPRDSSAANRRAAR
jgi:ABC-type transporter Mla MlaB component